jgi:hypothetical protein
LVSIRSGKRFEELGCVRAERRHCDLRVFAPFQQQLEDVCCV